MLVGVTNAKVTLEFRVLLNKQRKPTNRLRPIDIGALRRTEWGFSRVVLKRFAVCMTIEEDEKNSDRKEKKRQRRIQEISFRRKLDSPFLDPHCVKWKTALEMSLLERSLRSMKAIAATIVQPRCQEEVLWKVNRALLEFGGRIKDQSTSEETQQLELS